MMYMKDAVKEVEKISKRIREDFEKVCKMVNGKLKVKDEGTSFGEYYCIINKGFWRIVSEKIKDLNMVFDNDCHTIKLPEGDVRLRYAIHFIKKFDEEKLEVVPYPEDYTIKSRGDKVEISEGFFRLPIPRRVWNVLELKAMRFDYFVKSPREVSIDIEYYLQR